jgi:anti-sigma-K factor RskA
MVALTAGALTPAEQETLERHIAECAECRRLADEQKVVWSALGAWTVPAVSEDFDQRLHARIAVEARRPWWKREWDSLSHARFSWKPVLPVAAACVALFGVFLAHNPVSLGTSPTAPAAVIRMQDAQKVDVDQVERALDDIDMLNQLDAPVTVPHGSSAGS